MESIKEWQEKYKEAYEALLAIDRQVSAARGKGYTLFRLKRKKTGVIYYVKYFENGKEVPTRFTTHTADRDEADFYARVHRERLLKAYHERQNKKDYNALGIISRYYEQGSEYVETAKKRGRVFTEKTRAYYLSFIKNTFLPYLEKNKIKNIEGITPVIIARLQDEMLKKGMSGNTINRYLGSVRAIIDHLVRDGLIKQNIFKITTPLKNNIEKPRGCYEIKKLRGIFGRQWENETHYLLCALIYSTGLRNSEIERIKLCDIIRKEDCYFIDVKASKTDNGVRLVPLYPLLYSKIADYARREGVTDAEYIFKIGTGSNRSNLYKAANIEMGSLLGMSEAQLKEGAITFYSGRHFFKTLGVNTAISAAELGENIEEYFMGHAVKADVKKRYNHLDKRGEEALLKKAREVVEAVKELF